MDYPFKMTCARRSLCNLIDKMPVGDVIKRNLAGTRFKIRRNAPADWRLVCRKANEIEFHFIGQYFAAEDVLAAMLTEGK